MNQKIFSWKKLTDFKWLNLFNVKYITSKGTLVSWVFVSRKERPFDDDSVDAAVIVPLIDTPDGRKVVVIKEYRIAIGGYEYGFPAGLVENGLTAEETAIKELKEETGLTVKRILHTTNKVYASPGLSDESCFIIFVEAEGEISSDFLEGSEEIETILMGVDEIRDLLGDPNKKVGAKAWGVFYYYSQIGEIK